MHTDARILNLNICIHTYIQIVPSLATPGGTHSIHEYAVAVGMRHWLLPVAGAAHRASENTNLFNVEIHKVCTYVSLYVCVCLQAQIIGILLLCMCLCVHDLYTYQQIFYTSIYTGMCIRMYIYICAHTCIRMRISMRICTPIPINIHIQFHLCSLASWH
jgi:hypothetical protein